MASGTLREEDAEEPLTGALKALSFEGRMELLSELRRPRTIDEISLTPSQKRPDENPERQLTRQAIRHHLKKLQEADLVRTQERTGPDGRTRQAYVLDDARLYAIVERLRSLVATGTAVPLDPFKTEVLEETPRDESWAQGPKLVLVHGASENEIQPLDPSSLEGPRGWVIGRDPEAEISLQYDPYISAENTEIVPTEDDFCIIDLRTSKNGTRLNGEALPPGEPTDLDHGDIVQVGRSVLVFHSG